MNTQLLRCYLSRRFINTREFTYLHYTMVFTMPAILLVCDGLLRSPAIGEDCALLNVVKSLDFMMLLGRRFLRRLPNIGVMLSIAATKNQSMEQLATSSPKTLDTKFSQSSICGSSPGNSSIDFNVFKHFQWIGDVTPCFGVHGSQIEVLNDPGEFYDALKRLSKSSKSRILLASLYLGTGKLEQELVDCIYDATKASEEAGGDLRVKFLFDYMRGSRGKRNTRTMLLPLLKDFEQRVSVALYHTPDLRGLVKRVLPERINETFGVAHMKIYLFDDTIIMSGANLSESYFTDRQDRYIIIKSSHALANFFEEMVTAVSSLSFQLQPDDGIKLPDDLQYHPFEGSHNGALYRQQMKHLVEETISCHRDYDVYIRSQFSHQSDVNEQDLDVIGLRSSVAEGQKVDTLIYPLVQMGPFGIQHDEIVTKALFEKAPSDTTILLASGYFNLTTRYMRSIVSSCKAHFDILTAAPEANGFFGASGVSGAIPDAYTYIAKQFFNEVASAHQSSRISLFEYLRPSWTVHAKGLWYYLGGHLLPVMTMIGSPNFGYRSVFRDLEAQVVIVTQNNGLQKQLHQEQLELYSHSNQVTDETFNQPVRQIPLWVTYVTPIIRNFF